MESHKIKELSGMIVIDPNSDLKSTKDTFKQIESETKKYLEVVSGQEPTSA